MRLQLWKTADDVRPYMKIREWGASYFEGYGVGLLVRPKR